MAEAFIIKFDPVSWEKDWGALAHKISFNETLPPHFTRIDFALLVINKETNKPVGFATVRELDRESIYWQYGGGFPETVNTIWVAKMYAELVKWCKERYRRITTLVSNKNISYLKLCMKFGFLIIGVRCFKGEIFVELLNEFEEQKI